VAYLTQHSVHIHIILQEALLLIFVPDCTFNLIKAVRSVEPLLFRGPVPNHLGHVKATREMSTDLYWT
jgi:hypothetical protein